MTSFMSKIRVIEKGLPNAVDFNIFSGLLFCSVYSYFDKTNIM